MAVDSLDRGEDGEHNSVVFVEISKVFALHNAFLFETEPTTGLPFRMFSSAWEFKLHHRPFI